MTSYVHCPPLLLQGNENDDSNEEEDSDKDEKSATATGPDFNYLLNMPLWYLTKEKKDELCKQRDDKVRGWAVLERTGS